MFVSGIVVFELNVSTQPSMTSKAHGMSMGDSGEVGLLRMRLALVCPIQHQTVTPRPPLEYYVYLV